MVYQRGIAACQPGTPAGSAGIPWRTGNAAAAVGKAWSCRMLVFPTQMSSILPNRRNTPSCR